MPPKFLRSLVEAVFGPPIYLSTEHRPETDEMALTKLLADLGEGCATVPDHVLSDFVGTMYAALQLENKGIVKGINASYDGINARISLVTDAGPLEMMAHIYSYYDNGQKMSCTARVVEYGTIKVALIIP